jgi:CHAT domain-containing protein/tetratricopeptide (TPR) repeat protein
VPRLLKADRSKGLAIAEMAITIAKRLKDSESIAQGLRAKANALHAAGRNQPAIEHHRKAVALFRSVGNAEEVGRTLSSSIQPLILRGYYDLALTAAKEARSIFAEHNNQWRLARVELNLGNIYDRQDRVEDALRCYKQAYEVLSLSTVDDPEAVAAALHNMAVSYVRLNEFRRAQTTYEYARNFALTHHMPMLVGQADYNIAWLHYLRGDYHRALSMLRAARDACGSAGDEYHVALCHLDISEIYLEFNMTAEAEETAGQAIAAFEKLRMRYEKAKAIVNMAIAVGRGGNTDLALRLFLQARRLFIREKNHALPSIIDLYRALLLFYVDRDVEARRLCVMSLNTFQGLKLGTKAVLCQLLLARLHLRNNDTELARSRCMHALKALAGLESPVLECQANTLMGQIHAAVGEKRRSYGAYQRARKSLEQLRSSIYGEELKIAFLQDRIQIYEALVAHCLKQKRRPRAIIEAFAYIEQAKSRNLLDMLSTARSEPWRVPQIKTEFTSRIQELREELNWYFHKIELAQFERSSQDEVNKLRTELRRRERELLKISREHSQIDDCEVRLQASAILSVDQVRQALPAGSILLEYFQANGQIVVVLVGSESLEIIPLADLSEITTQLQRLQFQLSKFRLDPQYVSGFAGILLKTINSHLENLYKTLLAPILDRLPARHLIIAPHGVLHHLPFQALFDGKQYLIDKFAISYAPSASIYALCRVRSSQNAGKSLILGIPDGTVPFVQEEVTAIANCLPSAELFLGPNATIEILRKKGAESRFVHIATHGYFRKDSPMFSGIRLGGSYLSLYELYQLQLPAELVTLSGCSTGLNVVAAGDELLGLARGLIHAGAETSLLTLWDVQDHSSAQLMTSFYRHLVSGRRKPEALQQAMLEVRSEYPHPYYWAPFFLIGKG